MLWLEEEKMEELQYLGYVMQAWENEEVLRRAVKDRKVTGATDSYDKEEGGA